MPAPDLDALRRERQAVLDFCADLTEAEWHTPSRAAGWTVKDVVAHMAAETRALVTPAALRFMTTGDVEQLNERSVAAARSHSPQRVLSGFSRWTRVGTAAMSVTSAPALNHIPLRIGELGTYPARILPALFTFDLHTHLRHDIAPALGRPAPATDETRMAAILGWLMALLEQSQARTLAWLDTPVALTLIGPGGGTWRIQPAGQGRLSVRHGDAEGASARITGSAIDFPSWATTRSPWRDHNLELTGDTALASRLLDTLNLV
ncbi:maleylpyruvate isomerase family mycothiol-dependent enzyme [Nocardia huaxiensis]|uniref:Maleylpyruvate isomerase family mycothiol-dependent enzyme n=1 Tax=Nocardia huaxiensis TaxID=2755382 RepID=A0A7D6ZTD9_9NOCA|nr:maleylpyruvate isomerase family mycothiol-dependent enzyme [Nocardia huaxiensis]QLY28189.1 maleylpyruvate isomerase family mycothiol-dependent enzyme [Nocardia huaxiensis]